MEFLFFLFVVFIAVNVVRGFLSEASRKQLPPPPVQAPWRLEEEGHTPRAITAAAPDPWWEVPDADTLPEIRIEAAPEPLTLAVYDADRGTVSVAPRPLPPEPVALDGEVDREAEHARLHARIDRHPAVRQPSVALAPTAVGALGGRDGLRRAVLAAEVLGPPRALADFDR